jgi:Mn-containing catalase
VKETFRFLMTREVAHYQMFEAALATIQPNFPPGTLQADPRYSNLFFNMSTGNDFTGPWNEGVTTQTGETFRFIEDPISYVLETNGLLRQEADGSDLTEKDMETLNKQLGKQKSEEVNIAAPIGAQQWNDPQADEEGAQRVTERNANPVPGEDASITIKEVGLKKQSGRNGSNGKR